MWKDRNSYLFLLVICLMASACGLEKRVYRSGYYHRKDFSINKNTPQQYGNPILVNECVFENRSMGRVDSAPEIICEGIVDENEEKDLGGENPANSEFKSKLVEAEVLSDLQRPPEIEKRTEDTRDKIFLYKQLGITAVVLCLIGLIIAGIGISTLIAPLFLAGFVIAGVGEWVAIINLFLIRKLKLKYPEMRRTDPKKAEKFSSPYLISDTHDSEWAEYRKVRGKAEFLSWISFLVVGLGFIIEFGIILSE